MRAFGGADPVVSAPWHGWCDVEERARDDDRAVLCSIHPSQKKHLNMLCILDRTCAVFPVRSSKYDRVGRTLIRQEDKMGLEVQHQEVPRRLFCNHVGKQGRVEAGHATLRRQSQHSLPLPDQPGPPAAFPGPGCGVQLQPEAGVPGRKCTQRDKDLGVCEEGAAAVEPHVQVLDCL